MKAKKHLWVVLLLMIITSCAKEEIIDLPQYTKKEFTEKTDHLGDIHILAEQYDQDSAFVTLSFTLSEMPEGYPLLSIVSGGNTFSSLRTVTVEDADGNTYPYVQKYVTGSKNEDGTLRNQVSLEVDAEGMRSLRFSITIYINLIETLGESDLSKSFSTTYTAKKIVDGKNWNRILNNPQQYFNFPLHRG